MALQLEELKSCPTPGDIREALRTLPKTLKETYDKILNSAPKRHQPYIRAALQWIACSVRPLSLDGLAFAVVNDPAVVNLHGSENQLVGGGEAIQKMLSKLIDVHKVERVSPWDFPDQEPRSRSMIDILDEFKRMREAYEYPGSDMVVFSHSSVRDYLLQRHDDADVSMPFSFSEDMAHRLIAKTLLPLNQNLPETASVDNEAYMVGWQCLLMYLARHWQTHAARLPDEEPGSMAHIWNEVPSAVRFLMMAVDKYTSDQFGEIVGLEEFQTEPPSPEQKLHYAACSGSSCVLDIILASNPDLDVDASTESGETALSFACQRQHWQIAGTLLKRGADPNKYGFLTAPLFDASTHGADDIVRELISHSADVNVQCDVDNYNTPLTAAIVADHPSTVELLLVNGANPDIPLLGDSISVAAESGRHECMHLLLKYGASLDVRDIDSPSPLECASASGSVETVKLLLTQGLDVHEKKCLMRVSGDDMLPAIAYEFRYPMVEISHPSFKGSRCSYWTYGSPMHAAAAYGHTEVVKLLVENNAAVNERSHYWETPSTLARLRGHNVTLEYLMSKGGVALEQTEVCYRQDRFTIPGVSGKVSRFGGAYDDDDEEDNGEGNDVVSNDSDLNRCCEE